MSVARTCPVGPTAAASASGIPGPPAPTSQQRAPAPTPSRSKCPRVTPSNSSASQTNRSPASARALSSRYPPAGAVVPLIGSDPPSTSGGRAEEGIPTWSTSRRTNATATRDDLPTALRAQGVHGRSGALPHVRQSTRSSLPAAAPISVLAFDPVDDANG